MEAMYRLAVIVSFHTEIILLVSPDQVVMVSLQLYTVIESCCLSPKSLV